MIEQVLLGKFYFLVWQSKFDRFFQIFQKTGAPGTCVNEKLLKTALQSPRKFIKKVYQLFTRTSRSFL